MFSRERHSSVADVKFLPFFAGRPVRQKESGIHRSDRNRALVNAGSTVRAQKKEMMGMLTAR